MNNPMLGQVLGGLFGQAMGRRGMRGGLGGGGMGGLGGGLGGIALGSVLAGFSQGCAMALLTGLRYPERLAGIAGLSGYLPLAATTKAERNAANADVPIFLAHGTHDEVVALERAEASRDALLAMGYPVEWHEYLIGHGVHPLEVAELNDWLVRVLSAP